MVAQATVAQRYEDTLESEFAQDVVAGLSARPKRIAPKYFYDETGSQLFEDITRLREYYPTRTELSILDEHAPAIARLIPEQAALIELGSGSARKARILLDASPQIAAYVPVDISSEMLLTEAAAIRRDYPRLTVAPIAADVTKPFTIPAAVADKPRVGFFPGSTIGNFEPHEAANLLRHAGQVLGRNSLMIVGYDLVKDAAILNDAYDDSEGVTAKFNLNLLTRINRELNGNFDLSAFSHHAFYNAERRRVEMHLASGRRQKVRVAGRSFEFRAGETIHTENSYKYTLESFVAMARGAGWASIQTWTDAHRYFAVQMLSRDGV